MFKIVKIVLVCVCLWRGGLGAGGGGSVWIQLRRSRESTYTSKCWLWKSVRLWKNNCIHNIWIEWPLLSFIYLIAYTLYIFWLWNLIYKWTKIDTCKEEIKIKFQWWGSMFLCFIFSTTPSNPPPLLHHHHLQFLNPTHTEGTIPFVLLPVRVCLQTDPPFSFCVFFYQKH